ncbi:MAG: Na+/H+ antiporter subunit G [Betaproteobacteria bacterium]
MPLWADALIALLLVVGAMAALLGSYGLAKLSDFYLRLHAPAKANTLGVGGVLLASMVYFSVHAGKPSLHEVLIALFVFLTAPVSAHLLVKAALRVASKAPPHDAAEPPAPDA